MTNPEDWPDSATLTEQLSLLLAKVSPQKLQRLKKELDFAKAHQEKFNALTGRQRQVLKLIFEGKTSQEIADELDIAFNTVRTHRQDIRKELGLKKCVQGIWYALAFDLVE